MLQFVYIQICMEQDLKKQSFDFTVLLFHFAFSNFIYHIFTIACGEYLSSRSLIIVMACIWLDARVCQIGASTADCMVHFFIKSKTMENFTDLRIMLICHFTHSSWTTERHSPCQTWLLYGCDLCGQCCFVYLFYFGAWTAGNCKSW